MTKSETVFPLNRDRDESSAEPSSHALGVSLGVALNPTVEGAYWRAEHVRRPYGAGAPYEDFREAYRYGWEECLRQTDEPRFDDAELELERGWLEAKGASPLAWEEARPATRDAWERVERSRLI